MPTTRSTILDQISAEKTKISERLARLDADREKIATQLTDLETAERVLTRVGKTPPGRRLRSASAAEAKTAIATRGRGRPPRAAESKSAGRKPSAQSSGLGERVLALATGKTRQELYAACPSDRPNHIGIAVQRHIRGADPGARRQTLCDIDRNGAGARDSLSPDHKSTTAQFLSGFDEFAAGSEALSSRRSERPRTPPEEEDSCASKMLHLGDRNASDEICVRSRRSAEAAGREEHNLVLTARLPAAVAIFDVIAGCDPADPVTAASQASGPIATSGSSTRTARGWAWCTSCSPPRMPIRACGAH